MTTTKLVAFATCLLLLRASHRCAAASTALQEDMKSVDQNIQEIFMQGQSSPQQQQEPQTPAGYGSFVQHNYIGGSQYNFYYPWSQGGTSGSGTGSQAMPNLTGRLPDFGGEDGGTDISLTPARPSRPQTVTAPPINRQPSGGGGGGGYGPVRVPPPPQNLRPAAPQNPRVQPQAPAQSPCVRAILTCCPRFSARTAADNCLAMYGCPGPFWDYHPCDLAQELMGTLAQ